MSEQYTNLGLPATPIVENPELFNELVRVYNAIRNMASTYDSALGLISPPVAEWPYLGANRIMVGNFCKFYPVAFEALSFGSLVHMRTDGKVDKSYYTAATYSDPPFNTVIATPAVNYMACGYCSDPDGAAAGETTEITIMGLYPPFPAGTLTPGTRYGLGTTHGAMSTFVNQNQFVGIALTDTLIFFNPDIGAPL